MTQPTIRYIAQSRIERFAKHGAELANSIQGWKQSISFRAEMHDDDRGFTVYADLDQLPPLVDWGVAFGDAVHQLRSLLDNAAWHLAHLDGFEPANPRSVMFPIFRAEADWERWKAARARDFPSHVLDDWLQPCQPFHALAAEPDSTPALALLADFSNRDKHRVPHIALVAPRTIDHQGSVRFVRPDEASEPTEVIALEHRLQLATQPIMSTRFAAEIEFGEGQVKLGAQVVVLDANDEERGVTQALAQLGEAVIRTVDALLALAEA